MARYTFATLDSWVLKCERRMDAIVKDSVQTTIGYAQVTKAKGGRMPVDTGKLRNSLKSSISGSSGAEGPASHIIVAASMRAGDVATFSWTAEHAAPVNNGNRGRPGAHFREGSIDRFPSAVREATQKARAAIP